MKTILIKNQITSVIELDKGNNQLYNYLLKITKNNRHAIEGKKLEKSVEFIYDYISHVPLVFEAILQSAQNDSIHNYIVPMIKPVEDKFLYHKYPSAKNLPIIGFLYNAYIVLKSLHYISENFRTKTKVPLFSQDFSLVHAIVSEFIGEKVTQLLEKRIIQNLEDARIQHSLNELSGFYKSTLKINDVIWGNDGFYNLLPIEKVFLKVA